MTARYYVERDDLTGVESWVRLPVLVRVACHRCGGPSGGLWYCRPCRRHLAWHAAIPVGVIGVVVGLLVIAYALALWLGVTR